LNSCTDFLNRKKISIVLVILKNSRHCYDYSCLQHHLLQDQSRSHCFTRILQLCGINTDLKEHSNWVYLSPRPRLWRVCQSLSFLIQDLENILTHRLYLWTIQNTQLLNYSQNNFNLLCLKVIQLVKFSHWIPS